MTILIKMDDEFYTDLKALSDSSFPKKCNACGRQYRNVTEYIAQTSAVGQASGLKESLDDDDNLLVELFRNCVCGSTLMDEFHNRRDMSTAGINRRKKFKELLDRLTDAGFQLNEARQELLKVMRGEESKLIRITAGKKNEGK